MNRADAARVLTAAALYDNRKVDELAAIAWEKALDGYVTVGDALQAVADHYGDTPDWIMPAHVNRRVKAMRSARVDGKTPPPPPPCIPHDNTAAQIGWTRTVTRHLADGLNDAEATAAALAEMGLPPLQIENPRPVAALVEQVAKAMPRIPTTERTAP